MKISHVIENKEFIGRKKEKAQLKKLVEQSRAAILIAYGRRRVGKTELLEQVFRTRKLLKFEGVEGQEESYQRLVTMQQLAEYTDEPLLREVSIHNWIDVFKYIFKYTQTGKWTIYFEEVQWLANYQTQFVSELKYAWDNTWSKNPGIILIL